MSRTTHAWDPERYLTYADERGCPYVELDSSAAMIEAAQRDPAAATIDFSVADLWDWRPDAPVEVLVSNATLLKTRLHAAYPVRGARVVLSFRRIFAVARTGQPAVGGAR